MALSNRHHFQGLPKSMYSVNLFCRQTLGFLCLATSGMHNVLAQTTPGQADKTPILSAQAPLLEAEKPVRVQSLDRIEAERERLKNLLEGKPKAYEDKVMNADQVPLAVDGPSGETINGAISGARSAVIETRFGARRIDSDGFVLRGTQWGVRQEYRFETINHGEWVLQADTSVRNGETSLNSGFAGLATKPDGSRLTLRNLGFPVTPSTFADTAVGDIASEITDGLSRNYRFSLGTSTLRGISTRLFSRDFDFRAGIGARGTLTGGPYPGFESRPGSIAWAGYTQRFSNNVFAGFQLDRANLGAGASANAFNQGGVGALTGSNNSVAAAIGYGGDLREDGDKKARLTLLRSTLNDALTSQQQRASAIFFEGGLLAGKYRHEFGLFAASPNLLFGDVALPSDNRGLYWRVDHAGTRLNWGVGLDLDQTNPSRDPNRLDSQRRAVSGNFQYRQNRDTSFGASVNAAQTSYGSVAPGGAGAVGTGARSINANAFYATRLFDLGRSRISVTARRNETLVANDLAATGDELQWEHDWITGRYETLRPEFTTTLGYARDRSGGRLQTYPTAGLVFRYWADAGYSVSGNLRYTSSTGNLSTSQGLSGSLNSERVLSGGWRIGAAISLNQASVQVAGNGFVPAQLIRSNDKSAFVYLRWETISGTSFQSAGLRNPDAAGAGSISGVIYFDANRDGERQVDEGGAANVEVFLDQRFRVVTDKDGRFEFPLVSTGVHQLTLKLETIPLPWGLATDDRTRIDVPLRGIATTNIPVVRIGQ